MTGKAEWGIVYLGGGETGVVAIHSLSTARPLKVANFDSRFKGLDNKATISEWRFSAGERSLAPAVTSTQSGGPGAQPAPPVEQPAPPVEQPAPPVEQPAPPSAPPVEQPAPPSAPAVEEPAPPEPAGEESEAVDRE